MSTGTHGILSKGWRMVGSWVLATVVLIAPTPAGGQQSQRDTSIANSFKLDFTIEATCSCGAGAPNRGRVVAKITGP